MSFKLVGAVFSVIVMSAGSASANLVVDGGFEAVGPNFNSSGTANPGFAGSAWIVNNGGGGNGNTPVDVIAYKQNGGFPTGAFGETVQPPLTGPTLNLYGAYFSADATTQTLSQTINNLVPNTAYVLSYEVYAPANGRNNPSDATIFASIGNLTLPTGP